jgi:sec-independent protein translocase protein TatC
MSEPSGIIAHLIELRSRVLKALMSVFVVFLCLVYFAQDLYQYLAMPLVASLPEGASMIATDVASPFLAPFKLTLVLSFFVAIPFVLYQIWAFVAPGLYRKEKKLVAPLLASSTLLFYSGMAFAYYVVFPLAFMFFNSVAPEGVLVSTDISSYLNFVLKLFFAFGVAFEIPIAVILLCWTGVTSAEKLAKKRPYVVVGAFVVGMLLTPPDVISQTLLAIPMWILFEIGVLIGGLYSKQNKDEREETQEVQNKEENSAGNDMVTPVETTSDFDDYAHNDNPNGFEFDEADERENENKTLNNDEESQLKEDKNK